MKQTMCVLPVRCKSCGAVFDLWHELREQETLETLREQGEIQKVVNQLFCWHCRKTVSGMPEAEEAEIEGAQENNIGEQGIQVELQLSLAYE